MSFPDGWTWCRWFKDNSTGERIPMADLLPAAMDGRGDPGGAKHGDSWFLVRSPRDRAGYIFAAWVEFAEWIRGRVEKSGGTRLSGQIKSAREWVIEHRDGQCAHGVAPPVPKAVAATLLRGLKALENAK